MRLTARDAYWGAKLVTAFSDAQLAAVVASARLPARDAAYVERALRVRRDIIGRRYLRAVAAVENPTLSPDGDQVCFDDLAIDRGYVGALESALPRRRRRRPRRPPRRHRAGGGRSREAASRSAAWGAGPATGS